MTGVRFDAPMSAAIGALGRANLGLAAANETAATGREINNAADSPARWSLGAGMEADKIGYSAEAKVLALKQSAVTIDKAKAENAVSETMHSLKGAIVEATLSGASASELNATLTAIATETETAIDEAAALGAETRALEAEGAHRKDLENALANGISAVMDADMESAAVEQKQSGLQQELAVKALKIVNEAYARKVSLFV